MSSFEILTNGRIIQASIATWNENQFYSGRFNSIHLLSMPHISYYLQKYGLLSNIIEKDFLLVSDKINRIYNNNSDR